MALVAALMLCASPAPTAAVELDPIYATTVNKLTIGYVNDTHELVLASSDAYILPDLWSMYERTEFVQETEGLIEYYYVMLKRSSDFSTDTFRWWGPGPEVLYYTPLTGSRTISRRYVSLILSRFFSFFVPAPLHFFIFFHVNVFGLLGPTKRTVDSPCQMLKRFAILSRRGRRAGRYREDGVSVRREQDGRGQRERAADWLPHAGSGDE